MSKKVLITQSNYIPWKGYFDAINRVDEFIIFDDMQYTRRDWRNRNKIKTANGLQWLTIPVEVKGKYLQKINETRIAEPGWGEKHWGVIKHAYAKTQFFEEVAPMVEAFYLENSFTMLSQVNQAIIQTINEFLGIDTRITRSEEFELVEGKTERLVDLCVQVSATEYFTGPAAQAYMDESLFAEKGIKVTYLDYSGYPEYTQLHPPFEHGVSVLDLLFNLGKDAPDSMKMGIK